MFYLLFKKYKQETENLYKIKPQIKSLLPRCKPEYTLKYIGFIKYNFGKQYKKVYFC